MILGGEKRLSRHVAPVSENWLLIEDGRVAVVKPLGLALRLSGDSLSADLGVVIAPGTTSRWPWVSVAYHFRPKDRR